MEWDGKERRNMTTHCDGCSQEALETKNLVHDLHEQLIGNGDPEKGLIMKVRFNTKFRQFWENVGWKMVCLILAIPFTILSLVLFSIVRTLKLSGQIT